MPERNEKQEIQTTLDIFSMVARTSDTEQKFIEAVEILIFARKHQTDIEWQRTREKAAWETGVKFGKKLKAE